MGAYLDKPRTEKEVFEGEGFGIKYGGSSMQGWRKSMEDAHIAQLCLNNDPEISIFGVFDGHGGAEVAKFCQKYLIQEIQKLEEFNRGSMRDSLEKAFHKMDEMLRDTSFMEELEQFRKGEGAVGYESGGTVDTMEFLTRVLQLRHTRPIGTETPFLSKDLKPVDAGLHDDEEDDVNDQSESILVGDFSDPPVIADDIENEMEVEDAVVEADVDAEDPAADSSDSPSISESLNNVFTPDKIHVHAGCTAVVALKRGRDLFVANAGDSRGVLSRGGDAVALSEDHKPAHEVERSRILAAGGFLADIGGVCRVNGNLNLSRAIGDLKYKCNQELPPQEQIITAQPDVKIIRLVEEDEFFILACDGVWDVLTNQKAVDFVAARLNRGLSPVEVSKELLDFCLAKSPQDARGVGCDNMTAVVIQLTERPKSDEAKESVEVGAAQEKEKAETSVEKDSLDISINNKTEEKEEEKEDRKEKSSNDAEVIEVNGTTENETSKEKEEEKEGKGEEVKAAVVGDDAKEENA
mmetsp:Transcript_29364/g.53886  ORF Transcript_29364/g.53886 Transcript_29364/m.53886 type:complete len:522 (-) Transcript_29364:1698-3263(-)